jgi:hypothetical protein
MLAQLGINDEDWQQTPPAVRAPNEPDAGGLNVYEGNPKTLLFAAGFVVRTVSGNIFC